MNNIRVETLTETAFNHNIRIERLETNLFLLGMGVVALSVAILIMSK